MNSTQFGRNDSAPNYIAQLYAIWRYRWQIIGLAFASALATALVVMSLDPIYRSTVTLLIEPALNKPVNVEDVYDPGMGTGDYYKTQYAVIKSREVAGAVVDSMGLVDHPEFAAFHEQSPGLFLRIAQYLPLPDGESDEVGPSVGPEDIRRSVVGALLEMIEVEPVWGTRLVLVHVSAKDPQLAADAANTLIEAYIESGFEAKLEVTRRASSWLTNRLDGVKQKLEEAERNLQDFRDREKLVNVGGSRGLAEGELTSNMERFREARKTRTQLSNVYQKIVEAGGSIERLQEIPALFRTDLVQKTKTSYLLASENLVAVKSRYGPKHPKRLSAQARFDEAKDAYQMQLRNAADGVKAEYEIAQRTEQDMQRLVGANRGEIQRLDKKSYEMQVLEREVAANRELYDLFLTRFRETSATGDYESVNARVIDPAIAPKGHYRPRKRRSVILGFISGLFIGVLLALLRILLDDTFRDSESIENEVGIPVLGIVPLDSDLKKGDSTVARILDDSRGAYAEAVRGIRTGILLSEVDEKRKIIAVTSAVPNEGKSSLAINLAICMGQMERTLLIDADMRRPSVTKLLKLSNSEVGLTSLVAGTAERNECIVHNEEFGIDILAGGRIAPNPTELLASNSFQKLLKDLAKDYDRIILDTAPCQAVSDTLLIARHAHVILTTRADSTRKRAVFATMKLLQQTDTKVLGAALNYVDHKHIYGGYYYGYAYGNTDTNG